MSPDIPESRQKLDVQRGFCSENKLKYLQDTVKVLAKTMGYRERVREKAQLTVPLLADYCRVDLLDGHGNAASEIAVHRDGDQERAFERSKGALQDESRLIQGVIQTGEPIFVATLGNEDGGDGINDCQPLLDCGMRSLMIVPIVARGTTLGAMLLAYFNPARMYTRDDLQFMCEFCHHLGVVIDNARLYAELARHDKAKDQFLATLSHELRNPLAPIKNSLELLKLQNKDASVGVELYTIERQFDHVARLLNDLLDVARFTQGRFTLNRELVEVGRLVDDAAATQGNLIRKKGISFFATTPKESVWVFGDTTRLEQALTNILQNAAKFTAEGGSIELTGAREGDAAVISVRDTGIGIASEDLEKIFELYYTGRPLDAKTTGLGVGLLLVSEIVARHGGTVEAKSEGQGRGAEFIIRLPISEPKEEREQASRIEPEFKKKVLIVDDNRDAADSLCKLLRALGSDARAVYSGKDALVSMDHFTPDVMLLDITMPEMDGFQVASALRRQGAATPIVALTGHGLREDVDKILNAGFNSHLTKPVGVRELRAVLDQY